MSLVVLRSWSDGPPKVRGIAPSDTDEFVYVPDHRGQFVQQQVGGQKSLSSTHVTTDETAASGTATVAISTTTAAAEGPINPGEKTSGKSRTNADVNNSSSISRDPARRRTIVSCEEIITAAEKTKTQSGHYLRRNNEDDSEDNNPSKTINDNSSTNQPPPHRSNRYGSTPNISVLDVHTCNKTFSSSIQPSRWTHHEGSRNTKPALKPKPSDRILLRSSSTSPEQDLVDSPPPASPLSGRYRNLGPELAACIPKRQLKFGTNWLRDDPSNIGIKWSHRRSLSNSTPSLSHSQDFYSSEEEKMSSYSSQSSSKTPSPQPPTPLSSYRRRHFHYGLTSTSNTTTREDNGTEEITIHRRVETPGLESLSSLSSPSVVSGAETILYEEDHISESSSPENNNNSTPLFSAFNLKRIDGRYSNSSNNNNNNSSRGHRRPRQRQLLSSPSTPPPPPPDQHDYYRNLQKTTSLPLSSVAFSFEDQETAKTGSHYEAPTSITKSILKSSTRSSEDEDCPNKKSILKPSTRSSDDEECPHDTKSTSSPTSSPGGKTPKTDVILVHVIRKKLKVKSSGYDQSPSVSGSSDSGSDTTEGNPELRKLDKLTSRSLSSFKPHPAATALLSSSNNFTANLVKKNNIKNQKEHHIPIVYHEEALIKKSNGDSVTPDQVKIPSHLPLRLTSSSPSSSLSASASNFATPSSASNSATPSSSNSVLISTSISASQQQIEHKDELIHENLTTTASNSDSNRSNNNDSTSKATEDVGGIDSVRKTNNDEGRLKKDLIPQNFSSSSSTVIVVSSEKNNASTSSQLPLSPNHTAQVAEVEEKSESQHHHKQQKISADRDAEEGDDAVTAQEGKQQDETPVGIAPGCSAQFTSSFYSSSSLPTTPNNKDTITSTVQYKSSADDDSVKQQALVPSDGKETLNSCCLDVKGEVPSGAGAQPQVSVTSPAATADVILPCPSTPHIPKEHVGRAEKTGELCSECHEETCEISGSIDKSIEDCGKTESNHPVKDNIEIATEEAQQRHQEPPQKQDIFANDSSSPINKNNIAAVDIAAHVVDQVLTQVEQKIQETPCQSGGTTEDDIAGEERMERGKNHHQGPSPIAKVKIPVQAVNKYVRSDSSDEFETEVNIWRNSAVRESFRGFCQELLESSSNASSQDGLNEGRSSLGSSHEKIIIHVAQPESQPQSLLPCQAINEGVIEFEDDEDVEDGRCSSELSLNDRPETPSQRNNSIEYISVLDNVQVNGAVHRSQSDLEYKEVNGNEEEDKHQLKPTKWIISLDLGSRSSGFSYWYHGDPNVVHIGSWSGGNCFHKIPSWILTSFESDSNNYKNLSAVEKQSLISSVKVGQEALDTYMERRGQSSCGTFVSQWREFLQMDSEAARLLTFPYTLDSIDDEMDFVQLVTALVNFFGRAALGQIRSKFSSAFHKDEHLEWLITIPTSWNSHSRQCIREAAYKSGVVKATDGVNLIEDPMAAALFASVCGQHDNFLAVDVGGAFMHYSGFSRSFGKMIQSLEAKSAAFPTPETTFETLLTQIVSREFLLYYKAKYRPGWLELMRNFEKAKCKFDGTLAVQSSAFVFLPYSFVHEFNCYTGMQVSECLHEQNIGITWNDNGALNISENEMKLIMKPTLEFIVNKIEAAVMKNDYKNIVLTGGLAKCKFLKESVTSKFPALNLIMPKEFSNGILQGSTLSLMPNIQPKLVIKSSFSIGVGVMTPFNQEEHPPEKKIVKDGKTWCADAWDTLIKFDQEMEINSVINKRSYVGAQPGQSCLVLPLFKSSSSTVPKLVTDKSVVKCCELRFESTKTWQEIDLILLCRASELVVMAVDRDSVVHRVVIDYV